MFRSVMFALMLILMAEPAFARHSDNEGRGHGQIFPQYPTSLPHRGGLPSAHRATPDPLGNRVTEDHLHRVDFAHDRINTVMKNNTHVTEVVQVGRDRFSNIYRPVFAHRQPEIDHWVAHYNTIIVEHPVYIDVWHRHYFYGGFYWGFHPIVEIDTYFYNPMVYWFYVGAVDDGYYRHWYDDHYDAYPELHRPFEFHGVYYPTENLRQLLFGVSAMPVEKQARFRNAVSVFTRRLAQKMANGLDTHVHLGSGDIAVTHYEIIGTDDAVVLEGFVSFRGEAYNFKGLIDIERPHKSDVFVPATWDKNPSDQQLRTLDALNAKISAIKGEPLNVPATLDAAPAAGEVSADPHGEDDDSH